MRQAENMASLIDGYCQLKSKTNNSLWSIVSDQKLQENKLIETKLVKRDSADRLRASTSKKYYNIGNIY
jgi:hypothetical protein